MRRNRKPLPPGAELAGFTDMVRIGEGPMSEMFGAVEVSTGRPVALKVLKVESAQSAMRDAFAEELQVLGAVSGHPNVVTLYRTVTDASGRPTLVLELCRGSLAEQLRAGPLTSRDAVALGVKLAGALETAHRAGFLHRDVKPEAVLLTSFGEPVLSDFGVAVLQGAAHGPGHGFGPDLVHAAPEVLEDKPLSPATDVYGLAATLYEVVSGRPPFVVYEGESPASVILRILRDPVAPLRADDLPLGLADLLDVALAKEPGMRPATAADFAAALAAVEADGGWPPTRYVAWGETPQPGVAATTFREEASAGSTSPFASPGQPSPTDSSPTPLPPPSSPSDVAPGPAPRPQVLPEPTPVRPEPTPVAAGAGDGFEHAVGASEPPGPSVLAAVATPRNVIPPARADLPVPPEPALAAPARRPAAGSPAAEPAAVGRAQQPAGAGRAQEPAGAGRAHEAPGAGRAEAAGLAAPPEQPIPLPAWPEGDPGWPGPPRPWPAAWPPPAAPASDGPPAQWPPGEGSAPFLPAAAAPGDWPPPSAPAAPSGQPSPPAGWRRASLPSAPSREWRPPSEAIPRWAPPEGGWPPPAPPQPAVGWPGPAAGPATPRPGSRKRRWRPRRER